MTKFLIVEIEGVTSSIPRSNFDETDLDILADSILESGGILKPLVLKKIGFEKYEVIDGHFEYYAAVKAREKNPNRGEIVNAFIIPTEKEDAVLNQVSFLQRVETTEKIVKPIIDEKTEIGKLLDQNKQVDAKINQIFSQLEAVNKWLTHISTNIEKFDNFDSQQTNIYQNVETINQKIDQIATSIGKIQDSQDEQTTTKAVKPVKKNINSMTKNELLELAKQKNVKIAKSKTKAEIINAIETAYKSQVN